MLFQCIVSKINENLIETKESILPTISQNFDIEKENMPVKCKPMNGKCIFPDLELGFGPIIEASHRGSVVFIDVQGMSQCNIVENYVSFMDAINYLSSPKNVRIETNKNILFSFEEEMTKYKNNNDITIICNDDVQTDVYMDSLNDQYAIDIPLHLPVR